MEFTKNVVMATSENISALTAEHRVCGDLIGQRGKFRPMRCSGYLHHRSKRYIAEIRTKVAVALTMSWLRSI